MKVRATVSLNISGNDLVFAGRGVQESADIPQGEEIGILVDSTSDKFVTIEREGKTYVASHRSIEEIVDSYQETFDWAVMKIELAVNKGRSLIHFSDYQENIRDTTEFTKAVIDAGGQLGYTTSCELISSYSGMYKFQISWE